MVRASLLLGICALGLALPACGGGDGSAVTTRTGTLYAGLAAIGAILIGSAILLVSGVAADQVGETGLTDSTRPVETFWSTELYQPRDTFSPRAVSRTRPRASS